MGKPKLSMFSDKNGLTIKSKVTESKAPPKSREQLKRENDAVVAKWERINKARAQN